LTIVLLLIPLALLLAAAALTAFLWGVGNGQFDDLETPGRRILVDEAARPRTKRTLDPEGGEPDTRSAGQRR
jgi:cbb3-type cytochrome oxidase maturation protein